MEARPDFQIWFDNQAVFPYKKRLDFEWRFSYRADQDATRLHFIYQQMRMILKFGESWAVAPGYRQSFLLQPGDKWVLSYHPIFDFQINKTLGRWDWEYRNRFQYMSQNRSWENRNRILLMFPQIGPFRLVLYEELFYELFTQLMQQRHYFSLDAEVQDNFHFRLGYLLRYLRSDSVWRQQNILYFELYANY